MGPTWVLSAPDGPHVGPMNLAIRVDVMTFAGTVIITFVPHISKAIGLEKTSVTFCMDI